MTVYGTKQNPLCPPWARSETSGARISRRCDPRRAFCFMTYIEKLKDPRWQRRRLERLQKENFTCQDCGDTKTELQIHHRLYRRNVSPWNYSDSELQVLCAPCHKMAEQVRSDLHELMAQCPGDPEVFISGALEVLLRQYPDNENVVRAWAACSRYKDLMTEAWIRANTWPAICMGGDWSI